MVAVDGNPFCITTGTVAAVAEVVGVAHVTPVPAVLTESTLFASVVA